MKKIRNLIAFTFSLILGAASIFAQDSIIPKKPVQSIEFVGEGAIASNTITNNFIKAFYYGSFIDDVLKVDASGKIAAANWLGASSKLGFTYKFQTQNAKNKPEFSFSLFDRT